MKPWREVKALRWRVRFLLFVLGAVGMFSPGAPVLAQVVETDPLAVETSTAGEASVERLDDPDPSAAESYPQLTVSSQRVQTLTIVQFDAGGIAPQTASLAGYAWDLDDDGVYERLSIDAVIEHSYAQEGIYPVRTLAVTQEGTAFRAAPLSIEVLNRAPEGSFVVDSDGVFEMEAIRFESNSSDLDGSINAWFWDFGDGSTSTEQSPTHTYEVSGSFRVTLLVIDDDGRASAPVTQTVTIENIPPSASFSAPSSAAIGTTVQFVESSTDPSSDGRIVHVAWDFGDGNYAAGGPRSDGVYWHTYETSGTYTVTLYVIDKDGSMTTVRSQIRILGI